MKNKLNVLVTGCGGDIGQSIGKILLKSTFVENLYGIDISDKNAAQFIYPNFSVGLPCSHPEYLNRLKLFIRKNEIDIIIPVAEPEIRFFYKVKIKKIEKAKMIIASTLALRIGLDKYKTAIFLKENKMPYPKTSLISEFPNSKDFPLILKSKTGSGSKNIHVAQNLQEYVFYTKNQQEDYIAQELISNQKGEFTCGLYRSSKQEIRSIIFQRELHGGYSGYGEVVENEKINLLLEKLAIKLNLIGSINVQLRVDNDVPKIFEINPRFSSTVYYRHLFGFEDVVWSIEDELGFEISDNRRQIVGKKFYKGFSEYIN